MIYFDIILADIPELWWIDHLSVLFVLLLQATLNRFGKLKISCSNDKALKVMDLLGENHELALREAKTRIAHEMWTIPEAESQHTRSGTRTKDTSTFLNTCEAYQNIKASRCKSHRGSIIAFHNIDIHLEWRENTMSGQTGTFTGWIMKWYKIEYLEVLLVCSTPRHTLPMYKILHFNFVSNVRHQNRGWILSSF